MTGRDRPMNDAELDALLGTWMHEGPDTGPDRIAERAMLEVATTPQESGRITAMWSWMVESPVAWAAVILVLAIGLGVVLGPVLVGDETPTPTPSQSPSPAADALVPYISEEAGYQLLIPANWLEVDSGFPDAKLFSGPSGELMISYGTSIFDGGEVSICAPPLPDYNTCLTIDYGYSVPVVPSDYTGPISQEGWLDRCDGACPVEYTETTLDREPAGQDRAVITDLQLTYVSTFHNYRPIILYWAEPMGTADLARVEAMRDSFQFLDPGAGGSPPPFVDPTELILYSNPDDGYEMLMPRFWQESAADLSDPNGDPYPGVQAFGQGTGFGSEQAPGLAISVGLPDGSVFANCIPEPLDGSTTAEIVCQPLTAPTLGDMDLGLVAMPTYFVEVGGDGMPEGDSAADYVLSGGDARVNWPDYPLLPGPYADIGIAESAGGNCLGCPGVLYQVFTVREGQPVVLAFDWWLVTFGEIDDEYLVQMLESFTFLD